MEEMQGIMTLPQGGAAPQPTAGPQEEELFQAMRQDIPPRQFSDELLSAGSQVDPQVVQEFIDTLSSIEMPMEGLELLNGMVDEILATPQDYPRIRRKYLSQGVPEDILPPQFDPMFFAALNMAVDYLVVQEPSPMGMAGGGIADLAQYGRYGDTMLAHITPEEAALLKARGGSGTINPVTGLPEFWNPLKDIKDAFKSAGNAIARGFRSVGRAVKKFAQSTVGRIILPIVLGFFLGPAAMQLVGVQAGTLAGTAVTAFTGSATAAALRGENLREVLKSGATGAVLAAGAGEIFGHPGATQSPAPIDNLTSQAGQKVAAGAAPSIAGETATSAVNAVTDGAAGGIGTLVANTAAPPALPGLSTVMGSAGTDALPEIGAQTFPVQLSNVPPGTSVDGVRAVSGAQPAGFDYVSGAPVDAGGVAPVPKVAPAVRSIRQAPLGDINQVSGMERVFPDGTDRFMPQLSSPPKTGPLLGDVNQVSGAEMVAGPRDSGYVSPTARYGAAPPPPQSGSSFLPESMAKIEEGASSLFDKAKGLYDEYLNPTTRGQVTEEAISAQRPKAESIIRAARPDLASAAPGTTEARLFNDLVGRKAVELATPSMLSTYGPLAAAGVVGMAALGGFKQQPAAVPQMPDMMDPKYARPLQFGGIYGSRGYSNRPRMPVTAADGGIMALEMGGTTYPRKQGHIKGPGTGTSDSIPALLSDGEFVFTAKSVRNLGNGSRRKGAKRLYAMMKMLEERKV